MSWEARKGRGKYYTRSRRVGGQVVREYVGAGRAAEIMADFDRRKRAEHVHEAAERKKQRAEETSLDAEVGQICRFADLISWAVLLSAGFRNYRGQWRKRRDKK